MQYFEKHFFSTYNLWSDIDQVEVIPRKFRKDWKTVTGNVIYFGKKIYFYMIHSKRAQIKLNESDALNIF